MPLAVAFCLVLWVTLERLLSNCRIPRSHRGVGGRYRRSFVEVHLHLHDGGPVISLFHLHGWRSCSSSSYHALILLVGLTWQHLSHPVLFLWPLMHQTPWDMLSDHIGALAHLTRTRGCRMQQTCGCTSGSSLFTSHLWT